MDKILLPQFIDLVIYIEPGILTAIITVLWAIFIGIVTWYLSDTGYLGYGIEKDKYNKNIAQILSNYESIDSISNIKWIGMINSLINKYNIFKIRILMFLIIWIFIYIFKLLFLLSIKNINVENSNDFICGGKINDNNVLNYSSWIFVDSVSTNSYNLTQIKNFLNVKKINNITMLGNGTFLSIPPDIILTKNQTITVNNFNLKCKKQTTSAIITGTLSQWHGGIVNTTHFNNINFQNIKKDYVANIKMLKTNCNNESKNPEECLTLFMIANSYYTVLGNDVIKNEYNTSVLLYECTINYNIGEIIINETGLINNISIDFNNLILKDKSKLMFPNTTIPILANMLQDPNFLSIYDYPDVMINGFYNETPSMSLSYINDIIASHMLSSIDTSIDTCLLTDDKIYITKYTSAIKISFGYILISIILVLIITLFLSIYIKFNKNPKNTFLKFTNTWAIIAYILPQTKYLNFEKKREFLNYSEQILNKNAELLNDKKYKDYD